MRPVFWIALAYVAVWRLVELRLSARNARRVLARGGRRVEPDGMAGIVVVHLLWILGMLMEEALRDEPFGSPGPRWAAGVAFLLGEALRTACIWTLGERWNVRVLVLDAAPPIEKGIYRYLRHPNYVAVVWTLVALPLALGLPVTALAVLPLKLLALRGRIAIEERALRAGPGRG